jgi:hypothetical protein
MLRLRPLALLLGGVLLALPVAPALAADPVPYPAPAGGAAVTDLSSLHLPTGGGDCSARPLVGGRPAGSPLPAGFDCEGSSKLTDQAARSGDSDYDPTVAANPQEFFGRKGSGTNKAWESTTGRPDTMISVLDSGIIWDTPELADKVAINAGELPPPCAAKPCDQTRGHTGATYDANHDGIFSVRDYTGDPRITTEGSRGYLTPEDLIRAFSDGVDHDGNGYVNDIAGWDFYQHDNDPADDVTYGHGTGEAKDSSAQVTAAGSFSQCPNCRVLPLRVGDSFIADINHFAEAVVYAVDNKVSVVQEALGTLNHTAFAQAAVDYAYRHGVLVVASEADEEAGHHNYPAALNHTMVVNSVTHFADQGGTALQAPKSYLDLNGCTNFGGYTWVTVESNACSSDATGQSAGVAGLLYSAARNAVQHGTLTPAADGSGRPLSAEEAKQLFRLAADDVDFATPKPPGPANNTATTLPDSMRYVTTAGWDQITGWGRLNAERLVSLVGSDAQIPAEADITAPAWWSPLGTSGPVDVTGHVAAPRAPSYTYEVQVAPGVQGPVYPGADTWTPVFTSGSRTQPLDGTLATLDLAQVRGLISAAVPAYTPVNDPTSTDLPEKDAFRVRVVVHPSRGPDGIEQRQYFSYDDSTRVPALFKHLGADITASTPADLTGDGKPELILADGNGAVHAFEADGSEAPGFPVHTPALDFLPTGGDNAYSRGEVSRDVHSAVLLGSPAVADLDHTGYPSVVVTDLEGHVSAWDHTGHLRAGFPVTSDPAYSHDRGCEIPPYGPDCDHFVAHPVRDHINTVDRAFAAAASVGDLDPAARNGLEIVAGSEDGHLYAWHADGSLVPGFPVLLRDPSKIAAVDPVSHRVSFVADSGVHYGRQIVSVPTIAQIDGKPEILVNTDEEYSETPNVSLTTPTLQALGQSGLLNAGNTRTYAVWPDGRAHSGSERVAGLGDNAYVPGWPVRIADLALELLPDVGSGSDGSPVVAIISGKPVIATASVAGAVYLLNPDGTSTLGNDPQGHYITTGVEGSGPGSKATDTPSVASLGGAAFGRLGGAATQPSVAMGSTGLRRLLDVALPDMQLGAEDHVSAWNTTTGRFESGFPALMNDLQFFTTPAIADVDGTGTASVLQSSAVYDTRAYKLGGIAPPGWPKQTGGWATQTVTVVDVLGTGTVQAIEPTREGNLFVWTTQGPACQPKEWPKFQHDEHNSGSHETDATPPAVLRSVALTGSTMTLRASGDDGYCAGSVRRYVVTVGGVQHVLTPASIAPAGATQTLDLAGIDLGGGPVTVSAEDAAGNLSYPAAAGGPPSAMPEFASPAGTLLLVGIVGLGVVRLLRRRRLLAAR